MRGYVFSKIALVLLSVRFADNLFGRRDDPYHLDIIDKLRPWLQLEVGLVASVIANLYLLVSLMAMIVVIEFLIGLFRSKKSPSSAPQDVSGDPSWLTVKYKYSKVLSILLAVDLIFRLTYAGPFNAEPLVVEALSSWFQIEVGGLSGLLSLVLYGAIVAPFFLTLDILGVLRARARPQPRAEAGETPPTSST